MGDDKYWGDKVGLVFLFIDDQIQSLLGFLAPFLRQAADGGVDLVADFLIAPELEHVGKGAARGHNGKPLNYWLPGTGSNRRPSD